MKPAEIYNITTKHNHCSFYHHTTELLVRLATMLPFHVLSLGCDLPIFCLFFIPIDLLFLGTQFPYMHAKHSIDRFPHYASTDTDTAVIEMDTHEHWHHPFDLQTYPIQFRPGMLLNVQKISIWLSSSSSMFDSHAHTISPGQVLSCSSSCFQMKYK